MHSVPFSAFILLLGRQEGGLACENLLLNWPYYCCYILHVLYVIYCCVFAECRKSYVKTDNDCKLVKFSC